VSSGVPTPPASTPLSFAIARAVTASDRSVAHCLPRVRRQAASASALAPAPGPVREHLIYQQVSTCQAQHKTWFFNQTGSGTFTYYGS
jgi:hypothetical protein